MRLIEKAFLLKKTPLFAHLDLDVLFAAADKLAVLSCQENEVIFEKGDEATRMYFVASGKVQAAGALLQPPQFFGDEALFNERPRNYSAKALSKATLLTLSKTNLLAIISECSSVAIGLLQVRMP